MIVPAMLSSFVLLISLALLSLWCWFRITHRQVLRMAKELPKIQPFYPLLGSILLMMKPLESATDFVLKQCAQRVLDGCSAFCLWVGPFPLFLVAGADDMKKIMNNSDCLGRGPECESCFRVFTQYGLVISPGFNVRITRRHFNLVFHPRNLDQMFPQFNANSRELVGRLSTEAAGDSAPLDTLPPIMGAAIKTVCQLIFGTEPMSKISIVEFERLRKAVKRIPELLTVRLIKPWLRNDAVFKWCYRKELKEIEMPVVQFAKIARSKLEIKAGDDVDIDASKDRLYSNGYLQGLNILQLLRVKHSITEKQLEDELVSFYITGANTIGCGLSSCLLALAQYPEIQRKAYAEITSVMGDQEESDVTAINLKQMPFLDQLIKETHRFFMVTPIVPRMSETDLKLSNGCTLPAKTTFLLCIGALNLNSKVFLKPEQFNPDRFSPENMPEDCPFMPFGAGPRNCIGKMYSIMLMKVMLVHILRQFELSTSMDIHKLKKRYAAVMFSANGYKISLKRRTTA